MLQELRGVHFGFRTNTGRVVSAAVVGNHIEILVFDECGHSGIPEWLFDVDEMIRRFSQVVAENTSDEATK